MSALPHRIVLFPGSFDPITYGHIELVHRALEIFDEVHVGVGTNTQKQTMFTAEQRIGWIRMHFAGHPRVQVASFGGLTVQYAQTVGARFLLRGLRNGPDFEYEKNIDLLNKHLAHGIETVYMISSPATQHISSSLVREVIRFQGNLQGLVPDAIVQAIYDSRQGQAAAAQA